MAVPFRSAEVTNRLKARYNKDFCSARSSIERTIGILKARFPILSNGLRFKKMYRCAQAIQVMCCLHNFILQHGEQDRDAPKDMKKAFKKPPHAYEDSDTEFNDEEDEHLQAQRGQKKTSQLILEKYYM